MDKYKKSKILRPVRFVSERKSDTEAAQDIAQQKNVNPDEGVSENQPYSDEAEYQMISLSEIINSQGS